MSKIFRNFVGFFYCEEFIVHELNELNEYKELIRSTTANN